MIRRSSFLLFYIVSEHKFFHNHQYKIRKIGCFWLYNFLWIFKSFWLIFNTPARQFYIKCSENMFLNITKAQKTIVTSMVRGCNSAETMFHENQWSSHALCHLKYEEIAYLVTQKYLCILNLSLEPINSWLNSYIQ